MYRSSQQEARGPRIPQEWVPAPAVLTAPTVLTTPHSIGFHPVFHSRPCRDPPRAALTQQIRSQAGPSLDWPTHPGLPRPAGPGRLPTSDRTCFSSSPGPRPAAAAIPALVRQAPSSLFRGDRRHQSRFGAQAQSRRLRGGGYQRLGQRTVPGQWAGCEDGR